MPGPVLWMQNIILGQTKAMQIRQRETLNHQRAIIHEICLSSAQFGLREPNCETENKTSTSTVLDSFSVQQHKSNFAKFVVIYNAIS